MQTSLRRMGNSTGLIVPRSLLAQMGVTTGARMALVVENGKLVAAPVAAPLRKGWAEAAAGLEPGDDEGSWRGFGNEDDADLDW